MKVKPKFDCAVYLVTMNSLLKQAFRKHGGVEIIAAPKKKNRTLGVELI